MELATGAMGSLLPKLSELLKEEYGLQTGVKNKIESLSRELRAAHAVLRTLGNVPPDQLGELVRIWASEVREASYDMEDIVDDFLVCVDGPDEPAEPHKLRRLRKNAISFFNKSKARRNISSQIQEIYKKLEELTARRDRYKLDNNTVVSLPVRAATTIDPRILNLYKRVTELVGTAGPRDEIIRMLSLGDDDIDVSDVHGSHNKKMKIVSIVGFGGLGKTTLAKAVYDHLKPRFEFQVFVPVGQNPDIKKVFRDILVDLDGKAYTHSMLNGSDENQLICKLNEFVKDKRYLIVIDDIWDKVTWKLVRCALQASNCGSRLIITTRISEVATCADEAYKIQPLSHDDSEKLLFARIVDGEGKYCFDSPSAEACEKILKKCGGVPLAIITIASVLASRPGGDWSKVYNSIGFGQENNDDVTNTRRILSFSYYDLPSHLKACLLYLSVFPEDHVIEKNSLVWMWIAEGFVCKEQASEAGVGLFELGERYFNELINRNMIQARKRGSECCVKACSVHDMILDLILQLSSEENFVTVLNGVERQRLRGGIPRRLALQCVEEHSVGWLANIAVEKVRSIFAGRYDFCALFSSLPFLRVVEIKGCSALKEDCSKDVLYHLGSLLHLRYLRLQGISELPREVRYLRFLQTLDLEDSKVEELPEEVGFLTRLVCLRLPKRNNRTSMPAGLIGKLTSLQELSIFSPGEEDAKVKFVKELGLLRELRVLVANISYGTSESVGSALLESLGHLHNIQDLFIFEYCPNYVTWVRNDAGWVSSRHLRELRLGCVVFPGLPEWIKSSLTPNLTCLDLKVVVLKDQDMETLAKLPELGCIILHSDSDTKSVVRIKIRNDEGVACFRKLRLLRIIIGPSIWFDLRGRECNSSREVSSNTVMPSLEYLQFGVRVRSLKDEKLQIGFDKMLDFRNIGTSSLKRVTAYVYYKGASNSDVEEPIAALKHAAAVHPKHPTLETWRLKKQGSMLGSREV